MSDTPYDSKLKEAMAEIQAILEKHDIAAHITLVSPTHGEFTYHFPTWGVITPEEKNDLTGFRFRSKREDFASKQAQLDATEVSVHVLFSLRDVAANTVIMMDAIATELRQHMEIDHVPFADFTPARKQ